MHRPVETQVRLSLLLLLLLVSRRPDGAVAEVFWKVCCLLTVQRSLGVVPAVIHLPLLALLLMAVLLKRLYYVML